MSLPTPAVFSQLAAGALLVACSSRGPLIDQLNAIDPGADAGDASAAFAVDAPDAVALSRDAAGNHEPPRDAQAVESLDASSVSVPDASRTPSDAALAPSQVSAMTAASDASAPSQPSGSESAQAALSTAMPPVPSASVTIPDPPPVKYTTCGSSLLAEPVGLNGPVWATAIDADGTLYLGGAFSVAGPVTGGGVPFDTATGEPVPSFDKVSGQIYAVAADGAGGWYIGGDFSQVGAVPRNHLAHLSADGLLDPTWSADTDAPVRALAFGDNTLYVGGEFASLGGEPRHGLGSLDATAAVTAWDPDPQKINTWSDPSSVRALLLDQGTLYVGGYFNSIAGQTRHNLASFTADGSLTAWAPVVSQPFNDENFGVVHAIASDGVTLYVGGEFELVDGAAHRALARFDENGNVAPWTPDFLLNSAVYALALSEDVLYVGGLGNFGGYSDEVRMSLAAFDAAGALTRWNPKLDTRGVHALSIVGDTIYAGGEPPSDAFGNSTPFGGTLAAFDKAGAPLTWEPFADSTVYALSEQQGTLYVAGNMNTMCGATRNNLAAIDSLGKLGAWQPQSDGTINTLAIQQDVVYLGGTFQHVDAQARDHLAAVGTNGSLTAWNPPVESWTVNALAAYAGYVAVGGDFIEVGGELHNGLAVLGADGSVLPWNLDIGETDQVSSLLALNDTLYVAGRLTEVGGVPRIGIAAIGPDGAVTDWDAQSDDGVEVLATDGQILYAGGYFTSIAGESRSGMAAFDANGALLPWDPSAALGAGSYTLAIAATENATYAIGVFTAISGEDKSLLEIDNDGERTAWDPAAKPAYGINALAARNERVCLGGGFGLVEGHSAAGVACFTR